MFIKGIYIHLYRPKEVDICFIVGTNSHFLQKMRHKNEPVKLMLACMMLDELEISR